MVMARPSITCDNVPPRIQSGIKDMSGKSLGFTTALVKSECRIPPTWMVLEVRQWRKHTCPVIIFNIAYVWQLQECTKLDGRRKLEYKDQIRQYLMTCRWRFHNVGWWRNGISCFDNANGTWAFMSVPLSVYSCSITRTTISSLSTRLGRKKERKVAESDVATGSNHDVASFSSWSKSICNP